MLLHIYNVSNRFNVYQLVFSLILFAPVLTLPSLANPEALPEGREVVLDVVPEGEQQVMLSAVIRIDALVERIWAVLLDCQQALEYVPDIRECQILDSGVDKDGRPFDITMHRLKPYFFLPSVKSVFLASYQKPMLIGFKKQGGDLESFTGSWRFEPDADNQTVLYYEAIVNLSKRMGQRAEIRILRRDIPKMLKKLRELAETDSD